MTTIWTLDDCAEHLRCSRPTVRRMTETQGLPYFKLGTLWRFRAEDVLAWETAQASKGKVA